MIAQFLDQLRRAGWFDLIRGYPDRGPLDDVPWFNAGLRIGLGGAGAIVAANAEGLRVVVGSGLSAAFFPWSKAVVAGKRVWEGTAIRLQTNAVGAVPVLLYLDDADADAILRAAGVALPACRSRSGPWLLVGGAVAGLLASLLAFALMAGTL
jgi:hypothetical protein